MWKAIRKYWYIPITALVAVLGFIVLREDPRKALRREMDAIDAGERARVQAANENAEKANAYLDFQHRKTLEALNAKQTEKEKALRADPVRRAKWLTRLASRGTGGGDTG